MITLFTAPTNALAVRFYKKRSGIMCLSNPVCDTSQTLIEDTFSVLKTQTKLFTLFFEEKELHLKLFIAQTCSEIRFHKP